MGFASTYLEERALFPQKIKEAVDRETAFARNHGFQLIVEFTPKVNGRVVGDRHG